MRLQEGNALRCQSQKSREEPRQKVLGITSACLPTRKAGECRFWSLKAPAGTDVLWKPQDNDLGPVLFWVATCRWHGIRWCVSEFCWQTENKIKTKKNLIAWVRGRLLARGHARGVLSFEPEPRNGEHRAQTSQPVSPGRTAESWRTTVAGLSFFPFKVGSEKSNSEPHAFKVALCQLNHHSTLPLSF